MDPIEINYRTAQSTPFQRPRFTFFDSRSSSNIFKNPEGALNQFYISTKRKKRKSTKENYVIPNFFQYHRPKKKRERLLSSNKNLVCYCWWASHYSSSKMGKELHGHSSRSRFQTKRNLIDRFHSKFGSFTTFEND